MADRFGSKGNKGYKYTDPTTRRMTMDSTGTGTLTNNNGTTVAKWQSGMKGVRPTKSTGDTPTTNLVDTYVAQRKRAGTKGY